MKTDKTSNLEEPEKIVLDFLNYMGKETPLRFDLSSLSGEWTWVTSTVEGTTISMPAEFYTLNVTNYHMAMVLRYCPCEYCHEVVYVELQINDNDTEFINANIVLRHIKKAVPDMTVYITKRPKPLYIKNNLVDFNE
jgi:hypothetical protein